MNDLSPTCNLESEHEALLQFLYLCPHGMAQFERDGSISLINPAFACLTMPLHPSGRVSKNLIDLLAPACPDIQTLLQSALAQGMICDGRRIYLDPIAGAQGASVLSLTVVRTDEHRHMAILHDVTEQVEQERRLKENEAWLNAGAGYVRSHRSQMVFLEAAMATLGLAAEVIAGYTSLVPLWQTLAVSVASATWLVLLLWLAWARKTVAPTVGVSGCMFVTIALGLLYLNGGFDGSHLYPALWLFSLIGIIGMHGSGLLTSGAIVIGVGVAIAGKLAMPDMVYGHGADQSWARVAAMCLWWTSGVAATGIGGRRVIQVAKTAIQAREALQHAQAAEHALKSDAEQRYSAAATKRAQSLKDLARNFDGEVRTMVMTVAHTVEQITRRATALATAATTTGIGAADTASVAAATSKATTIVAQATIQLQDGLATVFNQTQAATAANNRMLNEVECSNIALDELGVAADQVEQAVTLIRGIATRTKLLALNARIEAARAGSAGLGFVVVAEEVKQLAKQTADTTLEVERLVDSMRSAHNGVTVALSSITNNIGQVVASAIHVDQVLGEQASAVSSIAEAATALHDKARRVSIEVSHLASSASVTSTAAMEMLEAADHLATDSLGLQGKASEFIVSVHAA